MYAQLIYKGGSGHIAVFQWWWRNLDEWGGWSQNILWFRRGWGIPRTTWEATLPGNSVHEWEKNLQTVKTLKTWKMVGPFQVPLHTRNLVWSESLVGPQTHNTFLLIIMKLAKVLMQHTIKWRVEKHSQVYKTEWIQERSICLLLYYENPINVFAKINLNIPKFIFSMIKEISLTSLFNHMLNSDNLVALMLKIGTM